MILVALLTIVRAESLYYHVCGHQAIQDKDAIEIANVSVEDDFQEIRIKVDFPSQVTISCATSEKRTTWTGNEVTCTENNILTDNQKTIVKETMANIETYIKKIIKVRRLKGSFSLKDYKNLTNSLSGGAAITGYDLSISIIPIPFDEGSDKVAVTAIKQIENVTFRPIESIIWINVPRIPSAASSADSADSRYYYSLLHETFHALGISDSLYERYHPLNSSTPHSEITKSLTRTQQNQQRAYHFLVTPKSHQFAINHYNTTTIQFEGTSAVKLGIELETSPGIEKSHPEALRYLTDIMTGFIIAEPNFSRITDVTLAMLLDTGFYEVGWETFQPIIWGNSKIAINELRANWSSDYPQDAYPSNYFYNGNYSNDFSTFDFKHYGLINASKLVNANCQNGQISPIYCPNRDLWNPQNYELTFNDSNTDWSLIKEITNTCPDGTALIPGNVNHCGKYTCKDDNSSFTFVYQEKVNDHAEQTVTCTEEWIGNKNITYNYKFSTTKSGTETITTISGSVIWCPDPQRFCRTVKEYESKFSSDPLYEYTPPNGGGGGGNNGGGGGGGGGGGKPSGQGGGGGGLTKKQKLIITIVCVCGGLFLIILIASICWYKHKQKEEEEGGDDQNSEDMYSSNSI